MARLSYSGARSSPPGVKECMKTLSLQQPSRKKMKLVESSRRKRRRQSRQFPNSSGFPHGGRMMAKRHLIPRWRAAMPMRAAIARPVVRTRENHPPRLRSQVSSGGKDALTTPAILGRVWSDRARLQPKRAMTVRWRRDWEGLEGSDRSWCPAFSSRITNLSYHLELRKPLRSTLKLKHLRRQFTS